MARTGTGWKYALLVVVLLAIGLSLLSFAEPSCFYAAVGLGALGIMILPAACSARYDLCSTWSFTALSVVIGLTLRGVYISLELPDEATIDFLFLMGEKPGFFLWPALLLLCGLGVMAFGYVVVRPRGSGRITERKWNKTRLYLLVYLLLIVSVVSTVSFIQLTGGFNIERLSAKRTLLMDVDAIDIHHTYGTLRLLASLGIFAHLLVLADCLRPSTSGLFYKLPLAFVLFVTSCILPFYASTRTPIAVYFCLSASMLYYSGRSLPKMRIALLVFVALAAVHLMTALRQAGEGPLIDFSIGSEVLNSLVVDRNNIGLCKTGHIINGIPDLLEYKWGETIWVWFVAPIPREVWPGKPIMGGEALTIGDVIFNSGISGVPPGYIVEMYWNFHVPGVLIGCLLLGMMLRVFYERFRPVRGGDPFSIALYVAGPMQMGFLVLGHSLGYGIFHTVINTTIMMAMLRFVRGPSARRRVVSIPARVGLRPAVRVSALR